MDSAFILLLGGNGGQRGMRSQVVMWQAVWGSSWFLVWKSWEGRGLGLVSTVGSWFLRVQVLSRRWSETSVISQRGS